MKTHVIPKNIRGFYLNFYDLNDANRLPFLENQKKYKYFLKNIVEILVISVFDSGEGMVKRYAEITSDKKEEDMSFEDKQSILKTVFLLETTSSKVLNSGMGLSIVEDNIKDLNGLLSIKTNTLEYILMPDENKTISDHI